MKTQEPNVRCLYNDDERAVGELLLSSFSAFLARALQSSAAGPERHLTGPK